MKSTIEKVEEFHHAFNLPVHFNPHLGDPELNALRVRLIKEETEELESALVERDPIAVLDALTDLQYVLDGAYLALGFSKEPAFSEVHRSNMSKLDQLGRPIKRADGKVLKGPNYSPPDLTRCV